MNRKFLFAAAALGGLPLALSAHESEQQKLTASDAAPGDLFGSSIVVEDTLMAVGAPGAGGIGAVYVFEHDGTNWVESAKLTPPDGLLGDGFGSSVANHGHEVVIGSPGHDAAGVDAGAAYVFVETAGVWSMTQKLLATVGADDDEFGHAVAMTHGKIAVSAPREASIGLGSVYVFSDATGSFVLEQELLASDGVAGNEYGFDVAFDGDTSILVGAPHQDGVAGDDGAAYVYSFNGVGWTLDQKLQPTAAAAGDHFGFSVDKYGKRITIGALGDDTLGSNAGAMYSFHESGGVWSQTLKKPGLVAGSQLGAAAATHGRFYIGAQPKFDGDGGADTGEVRLWFGSLLVEIFEASDAAPADELGTSVSMDTCWVVAGAPGNDGAGLDAGAAYVYLVLHPEALPINGSGINPVVMATQVLPSVGADWEVQVDTTTFPTTAMSVLYVYRKTAATPILSSFGEILVDLSSVFVLSNTELGGPGLHMHHIPIPNDPNLMGVPATAQALITSATSFLAATNGEEILIGCEGGAGHGHP